MLETHPYGHFTPSKAKYLLLGSFPALTSGDWFYGSKYNQFWKILGAVYKTKLQTKTQKKSLLSNLRIAISDIIYKAERSKNNSLDTNLKNIVYNHKIIEKILARNKIEKIYFTSRFAENKFRKEFKYLVEKYPKIKLITLPSSSPRYAQITLKEKIKRYKKLLPLLTTPSP